MNPELKEKWVKALRSGNYAQGQGCLKNAKNFCCLGVLCDVIDPNAWQDRKDGGNMDAKAWGDTFDVFGLPSRIKEKVQISSDEEYELIYKNDDGQSFKVIADYIEKNL